jgi:hypothetical protein
MHTIVHEAKYWAIVINLNHCKGKRQGQSEVHTDAYNKTLKFATLMNHWMRKISNRVILCKETLNSFTASAPRRDRDTAY